MSRLQQTVEGLDKVPAYKKPDISKLHAFPYKNFLVEHGRMVGEKKTVLHFAQVRCKADVFLELLRKTFQGRVMPKIALDSQVILGSYQDLGVQDAFSVIWEEDLSDGMLGWISGKVRQLDKELDAGARR